MYESPFNRIPCSVTSRVDEIEKALHSCCRTPIDEMKASIAARLMANLNLEEMEQFEASLIVFHKTLTGNNYIKP